MNPDEIDLAKALGSCSYPPATAAKRFARNMADMAKLAPDKELSDRQRHYMQLMAWRFRRQLPERFVPPNKPPDLPPKAKQPKQEKMDFEKPQEPPKETTQLSLI